MTIAAAQLGMIGSAKAQSSKSGTNASFGSLKQIDAGVLNVGSAATWQRSRRWNYFLRDTRGWKWKAVSRPGKRAVTRSKAADRVNLTQFKE